MEDDIGFAKPWFPEQAIEIDALASRDKRCRELCNDFSIADDLVRNWKSSTAPERDERYAEALELMDGLSKEIGAMLSLAKIVPFPVSR